MYVFGGEDALGNSNHFYTFDLQLFKWTRVEAKGNTPDARSFHTSTLINSNQITHAKPKMVMFGGYTDKGFSNDLVLFDFID